MFLLNKIINTMKLRKTVRYKTISVREMEKMKTKIMKIS